MRILVVGAGAIGGYFGGRLLENGQDVTFLVRPARAAKLAADGLTLRSSLGDFHRDAPATLTAATLDRHYDLILLSCKAYDLDRAIADIAPAVGPETTILPLLNGMQHMDRLDERFGADRVLGGQCVIAATVDADGVVRHLNTSHSLTYGERDGSESARIASIRSAMAGAKFEPRASNNILQDMWDKWVFLTTLAGMTCLMRASVGDIMRAPGGKETTLALLETCRSVAGHAGHPPHDAVLARARATLTEGGSSLTASMLRDLEGGKAVEADHVVGDMLARVAPGVDAAVLRAAYAHLKAYEIRRG
ncbi:MAG TPA: 2-dehydropantoate 2-reductase [Dyella sp.]|uniref:2-dehydropantoate 2-reductase n=1 Tax=Dyella sp. TaxID=1869338 RepID=UPI002F942371